MFAGINPLSWDLLGSGKKQSKKRVEGFTNYREGFLAQTADNISQLKKVIDKKPEAAQYVKTTFIDPYNTLPAQMKEAVYDMSNTFIEILKMGEPDMNRATSILDSKRSNLLYPSIMKIINIMKNYPQDQLNEKGMPYAKFEEIAKTDSNLKRLMEVDRTGILNKTHRDKLLETVFFLNGFINVMIDDVEPKYELVQNIMNNDIEVNNILNKKLKTSVTKETDRKSGNFFNLSFDLYYTINSGKIKIPMIISYEKKKVNVQLDGKDFPELTTYIQSKVDALDSTSATASAAASAAASKPAAATATASQNINALQEQNVNNQTTNLLKTAARNNDKLQQLTNDNTTRYNNIDRIGMAPEEVESELDRQKIIKKKLRELRESLSRLDKSIGKILGEQ
jgi:hypothetical protein